MDDVANSDGSTDPFGGGEVTGPPGWAAPASADSAAPPAHPFAPPAQPFAAQPFAAPPGGDGRIGPPDQAWANPPVGPSPMSSDRRGQLAAARASGQRAVRNGALWLAAGLAITVGSMVLAPGGFMIISFGPVIVGARLIMRGRAHLAKVDAAERSLR